MRIPLYTATIEAGFPSPAEGHLDGPLDLNAYLVRHPAATFLVRVRGGSMAPTLQHGDLLVVDRALAHRPGRIVVAVCDGEMTVKRLATQRGRLCLVADGMGAVIGPGDMDSVEIWGVATFALRKL